MSDRSVSILLPTFEPDPAQLRSVIEGVIAQTHSHWSLFIRDDASTSDVRAMVQPFLSDARITFVHGERRLGIGGNWNACLREANGDFVQFLFQDDHWENDYLAVCIQALEAHPSAGLTVAPHAYRSPNSDAQVFVRKMGYDTLESMRRALLPPGLHAGKTFLLDWLQRGLRPNIIGEPSFVMLRRETAKHVGHFREDLPQGLDLEYWVRCLLVTDIVSLDRSLGSFLVHTGGASMRNDQEGKGLYDRLLVFETLLSLLPPGELRTVTRHCLTSQLRLMVRKFVARLRGGARVSGSGAGGALSFFLHHPLLLLRSIFTPSRDQDEKTF